MIVVLQMKDYSLNFLEVKMSHQLGLKLWKMKVTFFQKALEILEAHSLHPHFCEAMLKSLLDVSHYINDDHLREKKQTAICDYFLERLIKI